MSSRGKNALGRWEGRVTTVGPGRPRLGHCQEARRRFGGGVLGARVRGGCPEGAVGSRPAHPRMQHKPTECNPIRCLTVQCNTAQDNRRQRNTMQWNAIECNAMQYYAVPSDALPNNTTFGVQAWNMWPHPQRKKMHRFLLSRRQAPKPPQTSNLQLGRHRDDSKSHSGDVEE